MSSLLLLELDFVKGIVNGIRFGPTRSLFPFDDVIDPRRTKHFTTEMKGVFHGYVCVCHRRFSHPCADFFRKPGLRTPERFLLSIRTIRGDHGLRVAQRVAGVKEG